MQTFCLFSDGGGESEVLPGIGVLWELGDCAAEPHNCYCGDVLSPPSSPMISLDAMKHYSQTTSHRSNFVMESLNDRVIGHCCGIP